VLTKNIIYYEARITFGFTSLLPLLLLPGYTFLGWMVWAGRGTAPSFDEAVRVFEFLLSLSGGLAAAHLMTIEREEGFDELRRSYSERRWQIPILRSTITVMFITASAAIAAGIFYFAFGSYNLRQLVLPAFAPAFYLCGLALLINNVSGSYWISASVIAAYWFGEFLSGGYFSQSLYLFNHSAPFPGVDAQLNRLLLVVGFLIFALLNTVFTTIRRRGRFG
jgi:hypothetical protein